MVGIVLSSMVSVAVAGSSWQKDDASQWTSEDVYQILNNSPWSKSVSVTVSTGAGNGEPGSQNGRNGGTWGSGGQMPGGGMGRRNGGWGGGGTGRGRGNGGSPPAEQQTSVTVQWESALPVRLAEAKSSGGTADAAVMKPLNEYVVAVIGFPKSGFRSQGPSSSSEDDPNDASLADHLKVITVLSVGHERLNPTKVELNRGRDGRALFHFTKEEPITLHDKDVEFRITADHMELRKKFALKEMEFQGTLAI